MCTSKCMYVCMYVCVSVWKLRCIFEWSWTKLLHRLCPCVSLLGAHLFISRLVSNTGFLLSTRTKRCLESAPPPLFCKTSSVSSAASYKCFKCILWYFVAKTSVALRSFYPVLRLKATHVLKQLTRISVSLIKSFLTPEVLIEKFWKEKNTYLLSFITIKRRSLQNLRDWQRARSWWV